ncbi:MAG: hypothetical protein JW893_02490 [Candidatus Omnitrophica bacterium]|nr:hypothetical protein [Candidatus Omnitrophota bacterium]
MSLIQQALEKTGRLPQDLSAATSVMEPPPKQKELPKRVVPKPEPKPPFDFHKEIRETHRPYRAPVLDSRTKKNLMKAVVVCCIVLVSVMVLGAMVIATTVMMENFQRAPKPAVTAPKQPVLRESFEPVVVRPRTSKYVLSGITTSAGRQLALINNRIYMIGDEVNQDTVVKDIQGRSVILEQSGEEIILSM